MSTGANYGEVEGKVDQLAGSRSLVKSTKKKVSSAKFTLEKLKNDMEMYLGPEANSVYSKVKNKPNDFLRDRRPIVKMVSTAIVELNAAVLEHNNAQKSLSEANEYAQKGDTTLLDLRILFEKALQRYDDSHWKHVGTLKNMDALRLEYNLMRWEYGIQIHGGSVHPISVQKDGITVNGTFVYNQTTGNYFLNKKSIAVPMQQDDDEYGYGGGFFGGGGISPLAPQPQPGRAQPPGRGRAQPGRRRKKQASPSPAPMKERWQLFWVSGGRAVIFKVTDEVVPTHPAVHSSWQQQALQQQQQQQRYIQPSDDVTDEDADNFPIFIRRH